MIIKAVSLFLIFIVVLAMFGRLRVPGVKKGSLPKSKKCKECGSYIVGSSPCECQKQAK